MITISKKTLGIGAMNKNSIRNQTRVLRWTKQVKQIIDVVYSADQPLTADDVYSRVKKYIPRISLGTVYRNLKKLVDSGLISYIEKDGVHTYFRHPFSNTVLRCIKCGRFFSVPFELDLAEISRRTGFIVTGWALSLNGICRRCEEDAYYGRVSSN